MSDSAKPGPPAKGQFLVYQTEDGQLKIDVRLEGETAWLTQAHMAELFQTTVPNVSMHLRNVYAEGELQAAATVKEFLIVRQEGSRQVSRAVEHYNLDAIISVGYRVKSAVATRFRIWATQKLREFIVKGFVLDDCRRWQELPNEVLQPRCHHLGRLPRQKRRRHPLSHLGHTTAPRVHRQRLRSRRRTPEKSRPALRLF